jgi:hypothetical protein
LIRSLPLSSAYSGTAGIPVMVTMPGLIRQHSGGLVVQSVTAITQAKRGRYLFDIPHSLAARRLFYHTAIRSERTSAPRNLYSK